jgi:hypothetical protein
VVSFPQVSPPKPYTRLFPPHPLYMPRPSHSSRFYHPHNNTNILKHQKCYNISHSDSTQRHAVCLTSGPKPLSMPVIPIRPFSDSYFKFQVTFLSVNVIQ